MIQKLRAKYKALSIQMKASLWFLICSFMQKGISTITTPIFTRLLTTKEYGNYGVFNSWLSIVTIFVSLHLYSGVYTSGLVKFKEERKIFASSLQGMNLTLCVAWTVVYIIFRHYINKLFGLTTVQMLCMLVMIWASAAYQFWAAAQRVEYKYKKLVIVSVLVSFFKPVTGIIFVKLAEDKVTARILGLVVVELAAYTGLFISQMRKGKAFYSGRYWKYALFINLPLVPHYLSQTVLNSADRIMIKEMIGASEAGIYTLAYSISQIMRLFNTSLTNTISPWMYEKIKEKNLKPIDGITNLSLIFVATVNFILIALAPELVSLFAPKAYFGAIWVIPPVAMSVYLIFMYDFFARFELYYEKTIFMMIASVAGAALNILLNYIFIRIFGYIAAGYTTLACYLVYVVCHYIAMRKICVEHFNGERAFELRKIVVISIAFFTCGFLMMLTYPLVLVRYTIICIGFVLGVAKRKKINNNISLMLSIRKKQ